MMPLINLAATLLIVVILAWTLNTRPTVFGNARPIVNVCLALILVGIVLWLINTYIPMAGSIKDILNIVVVLATCVGVLQALGLWDRTIQLWDQLIHHRDRLS